jgi:hypothetical protein
METVAKGELSVFPAKKCLQCLMFKINDGDGDFRVTSYGELFTAFMELYSKLRPVLVARHQHH